MPATPALIVNVADWEKTQPRKKSLLKSCAPAQWISAKSTSRGARNCHARSNGKLSPYQRRQRGDEEKAGEQIAGLARGPAERSALSHCHHHRRKSATASCCSPTERKNAPSWNGWRGNPGTLCRPHPALDTAVMERWAELQAASGKAGGTETLASRPAASMKSCMASAPSRPTPRSASRNTSATARSLAQPAGRLRVATHGTRRRVAEDRAVRATRRSLSRLSPERVLCPNRPRF